MRVWLCTYKIAWIWTFFPCLLFGEKRDVNWALGYYGGFHYWEGQGIEEWKSKGVFPLARKTHSNFYFQLGTSLSRYHVYMSLPYFYNYLHSYNYGPEEKAWPAQSSQGLGDFQLGIRGLFRTVEMAFIVPSFYSPHKNSEFPQSDSVENFNLEPWSGLGMFRINGRIYKSFNSNYVYGNLNISLFKIKKSAPISTGDSKIELGWIRTLNSKKNIAKLGIKGGHSRFHWYGAQNSPRVEMELVPVLIAGKKINESSQINISLGFTLRRWVIDPVNPGRGSKSITVNISFLR